MKRFIIITILSFISILSYAQEITKPYMPDYYPYNIKIGKMTFFRRSGSGNIDYKQPYYVNTGIEYDGPSAEYVECNVIPRVISKFVSMGYAVKTAEIDKSYGMIGISIWIIHPKYYAIYIDYKKQCEENKKSELDNLLID